VSEAEGTTRRGGVITGSDPHTQPTPCPKQSTLIPIPYTHINNPWSHILVPEQSVPR